MEVKYQVFISSTSLDLQEEREQVSAAVIECDCIPVQMERFPASPKSQWEYIKRLIDDCDIYLVVIAGKYGSIDESTGISYTEMEFDYAFSQKKPIITLVRKDINSLARNLTETSEDAYNKLVKFREKALDGRLAKFWNNKDELKTIALQSIMNAKELDLPGGWVKKSLMLDSEKLDEKIKELEQHQRLIEHRNTDLEDKLEDIELFNKLGFWTAFVFFKLNDPANATRYGHALNCFEFYVVGYFTGSINTDAISYKCNKKIDDFGKKSDFEKEEWLRSQAFSINEIAVIQNNEIIIDDDQFIELFSTLFALTRLIPSNFLSNTQIDPINDRIIRLMFSKRIIVEDICNKIMHALFYKDIYLKTEENELYSTYWE